MQDLPMSSATVLSLARISHRAAADQCTVLDIIKLLSTHKRQYVFRNCLSRPWLVFARPYLLFTQKVATATLFAPERRPVTRALRQHPGSR